MRKYKITIIGISMLFMFALGCYTANKVNASTGTINYYFTRDNGNCNKHLITAINSAHNTLDIAIYSITKHDIVDSIIAAEKRGVKVRIITDKTEAGTKYQSEALRKLEKAGIEVKEDTHTGLMHLKNTIVDNKIVCTGSYNYSDMATKYNDDVLITIKDNKIAKGFDKEFKNMWDNKTDYQELEE